MKVTLKVKRGEIDERTIRRSFLKQVEDMLEVEELDVEELLEEVPEEEAFDLTGDKIKEILGVKGGEDSLQPIIGDMGALLELYDLESAKAQLVVSLPKEIKKESSQENYERIIREILIRPAFLDELNRRISAENIKDINEILLEYIKLANQIIKSVLQMDESVGTSYYGEPTDPVNSEIIGQVEIPKKSKFPGQGVIYIETLMFSSSGDLIKERVKIATYSKEKSTSSREIDKETYDKAVALIRVARIASPSLLQRRLRIGYPLAADIVDKMYRKGLIGPKDGARPRQVLIPEEEQGTTEAPQQEVEPPQETTGQQTFKLNLTPQGQPEEVVNITLAKDSYIDETASRELQRGESLRLIRELRSLDPHLEIELKTK